VAIKLKLKIVGYGENKETVWDGGSIFQLMDSGGIPLIAITAILRRRGEAFDVFGFIQAALISTNYQAKDSPARLKRKIMGALIGCDSAERKEAEALIDSCFKTVSKQESEIASS